MRAQGALEYLIIIAAVLGISAVVVLFIGGTFTGSSGGADLSKCRLAAANCQKDMATGLSSTCPYCDTACVDSSGKDLLSKTQGCGTACEQCKKGSVTSGGSSPGIGLLNYWKMDEGIGTSIGSSAGGYTGSLGGTVVGNFESVLDGFGLDCGGLPTSAYVAGKVGTGLEVWSTGGDGLACASKNLGSARTIGYTMWFYGKGYVNAGAYNGSEQVSFIEDAETGCSSGGGNTYMYTACNGGNPYTDWKLFKLILYKNSYSSYLAPHLYNRGGGWFGETNASYYDSLTDGPVWVDGNSGKALRFDGYDDYVQTTYSGPFLQNMTASVWFKINDWAWRAVAGRFHNNRGWDQGWMLYRNQGWSVGQFGWLFYFNATNGRTSNILPSYMGLSTNTWYHAAAVIYSNGSYATYLNGNPYLSGVAPSFYNGWGGNYTDPSIQMTIGRGGPAVGWWMNGTVDDLRVYDRSMSPAEIAQIYSGG